MKKPNNIKLKKFHIYGLINAYGLLREEAWTFRHLSLQDKVCLLNKIYHIHILSCKKISTKK